MHNEISNRKQATHNAVEKLFKVVECEIKFKQADKALPINIEMLTKENRNDNKT